MTDVSVAQAICGVNKYGKPNQLELDCRGFVDICDANGANKKMVINDAAQDQIHSVI